MKILPIKLNNYNSFGNLKLQPAKIERRENNSTELLTFTGLLNQAEIIVHPKSELAIFNEFTHRNGKVTEDEYLDILQNNPKIIDRARERCSLYEQDYLIAPNTLAHVAIDVDKYLKENYSDYRIISLGTSPAILTEQLALSGHDVIFLPVSGLRKVDFNDLKKHNYPELMILLEYLKSKNIDDGKLNIILDYTDSGTTLDTMTKLIKEECALDEDKILKMPLDFLIKNSVSNELVVNNYLKNVALSNVDNYSNVPHFPVMPQEALKYRYMRPTSSIIFDDEFKKFYLDENTTKEQKEKLNETIDKLFNEFSLPAARCFSICALDTVHKLKNA